MAWRKWFVRTFVFTVVAGCAAGAYVYEQFTNPAAVREQVLGQLGRMFPEAEISVDSARLRLMGGIQVGEIRIARRDDADPIDAVQIPSAVIYHDKEKLLEGEFSLRKIEMYRPRFRVYRRKNGQWNVDGLMVPTRLDRPMPTMVVHYGTILLEDHSTAGNISSLEITDVHLIMINDPLPTITFEGAALSAILGKVTVTGTLVRATGELELHAATKDLPLGPRLVQQVATMCSKQSLELLDIRGMADASATVHYDKHKTPSLTYEAAGTIRKMGLRHPSMPADIDEIDAEVRIADGMAVIERAAAKVKGATMTGHGAVKLKCPENDFDVHALIDGLPIDDDIVARMPEAVRETARLYQPSGTVGVRIDAKKRDGKWTEVREGRESSVAVLPERARCVFQKFTYPLSGIEGEIECELATKKTTFNVTALANGQPVSVRGHSQGSGADLELSAEIQAAGVPIDETLISALAPAPEKLARAFHAKGLVDARVLVRHKKGVKDFDNEFLLGFRQCEVAWEPFPLPLKNVSGRLDIHAAGSKVDWKFRDFRGQQDGGAGLFEFHGRSYEVPGKSEPGVEVQITGTNVALTPAFHRALEPMAGLKNVWGVFRPSGTMSFAATVHRPTAALEDLEVNVLAQGASITPAFFQYRLDQVQGEIGVKKGRVEARNLSARHGASTFVLPTASADITPAGGYVAELPNLDITQLVLDEAFLKALPAALREACESLALKDPLRVQTKLVIAQSADIGSRPDIYWNAQAWLKDGRFSAGVPIENVTGVIACRGRYNGQRIVEMRGNFLCDHATIFKQSLRNIQAHFLVDEKAPTTMIAGLFVPHLGGEMACELRLDFQNVVKFELNLTATQIDLKKLGENTLGAGSQLEGTAGGKLHLTGTGAGIESLEGNGAFDVVAGKLYNLPLILDVLKFLGLRWPDRTAFEEVHALFRIRGRRVSLRKLELQGNAVSLTGAGDFNLDGSDLHVDFYPSWARFDSLLPPALRSVPPAVSKNFLIIEMRGKVTGNEDDLKINKKLMPVVFDPLLNVRDRVIGPTLMGRDFLPGSAPPAAPAPPAASRKESPMGP